jgi:hypothetical protein
MIAVTESLLADTAPRRCLGHVAFIEHSRCVEVCFHHAPIVATVRARALFSLSLGV